MSAENRQVSPVQPNFPPPWSPTDQRQLPPRWGFRLLWLGLLLLPCALSACRRSQPSSQPDAAVPPQPVSSTSGLVAQRPKLRQGGGQDGGDVQHGGAFRCGKSRTVQWVYPHTPLGRMVVVTFVPSGACDRHKLPLLVAWHGQGEALRGPDRGARGWLEDYWLKQAHQHLRKGKVARADFLGMITDRNLKLLNETLRSSPYEGVVVMCPYTPIEPLRGPEGLRNSSKLADFTVDELLPRARKQLPVLATTAATGIDGVSLGGRAAVLVGLHRPEAFGSVGGLQPAFDRKELPWLVNKAQHALQVHPDLKLRLLTSQHDYYLETTRALGRAWKRAGVPHTMFVAAGPHGYDFNRGPGAHWMLIYHDRVLRGLPPGPWNREFGKPEGTRDGR